MKSEDEKKVFGKKFLWSYPNLRKRYFFEKYIRKN